MLHLRACEGTFHRAHQAIYLIKPYWKRYTQRIITLINTRNNHTQQPLQQLQDRNDRFTRKLISSAQNRNEQAIYTVSRIILSDSGLRSMSEDGDGLNTRSIYFTVTEGCDLPDDGFLERMPALTLARLLEWIDSVTLALKSEDRSLVEVDFSAIFSIGDPLQSFTEKKKLWSPPASFSKLYHDMILAVSRVDSTPERMNPLA